MIIFSKETLREALNGLRVLKLSKQVMPVLRQVLVFGYEELIEFAGTDLDQYLRYEGIGTSTEALRILVPYDLLHDVAKKADAGTDIQIQGGDAPLIRYHASGVALDESFNPVALAEFPAVPISDGDPIALPVGVLAAMNEALGSASTDPTRHILNSVYLDAHAVVATDGRQLYRRNSLELAVPKGAVFPASPVLGILPHDEVAHLWLWHRDERPFAQITVGRWRWITKLVDGNFPNYQHVIPKLENCGGLVRISEPDAVRLQSVLPKLPGYKDKDSKVVLSVTDKGAVIRTAANLPKVHVALDRSEVVSTPFSEVAFNSRYLLSALQRGMRELRTRDHVSPLMMTDANRIHLWMPLRDAVSPPEPAASTEAAPSPSDSSGESPVPVVPSEPAVQVSAVSETNVSENQPINTTTIMVAPSTTTQPVSETREGGSKPVASAPRVALPETPVSAVDAVQAKLGNVRDLLRELGNEIGGLQGLLRESTRQYKALERDHESLKKNIRALREVPV